MSPADYHHPHLPPHLQYHFPPSSNNASLNGNSSFVSPRKRYLRDFDPTSTAGGTNGGGPSPAKHRRLSTDQSQQPPPRLNSIDQSQQRLGSTDSSLGGGGGSDRSSPYRTATPASPYRPSPLSPHPMAASPRPPKSASGSAFSSFSIDSLMSQGGGPSSPRQGPASPSRPQAIKRETGTTLFVPVAVKREDNSNSLPSPHHSSLRRDHETATTFGSSPSRVVPSTSAHSPFLSSSRTPPPPSTPSFASFPGYPGYHPLLAAHQAAAAAALLDPRMAAQLAAAAAAYPFPGLFHHSPFAAAAASPFHHLSSSGFGSGQQQPVPPAPVVWTPPVATPTPPPQRTPLKNEPPPPSPPKSGHALGTSYTASAAAPPVDFSRPREGADGRPTYGRPDMTAQCSRPQPTHQQVKTAAAASGSADGERINF
jgi:hypothetical protein